MRLALPGGGRGLAWRGVASPGLVWSGLVWFGLGWYGMVWYGLVVFGCSGVVGVFGCFLFNWLNTAIFVRCVQ